MNSLVTPALSWKTLFETSPTGKLKVPVRVFTRNGQPLLVIPKKPRLPSRTAFSLYAPQTPFAQFARKLWQVTNPLGFAPSSYTDSVQLDLCTPFVRFLASTISALESNSPAVPTTSVLNIQSLAFSLLLGNPNAPAPRFLIQLFDSSKRPVAVVKAGVGPAAAALIDREAKLLTKLESKASLNLPSAHLGIPQTLGTFSEGELHAFSMIYVDGNSPTPAQSGEIMPILNSWLHKDRKVRVADLPAWKRLAEAATEDPLFRSLEPKLGPLCVTPALFHGDFVPWNIKVSLRDGSWTVLDWERGELDGPPAWDWFHYVLQTAILVEKRRITHLARRVVRLMHDREFQTYSEAAGFKNDVNNWLLAYVLYCQFVIQPREGAHDVADLRAKLSKNHFS